MKIFYLEYYIYI